MRCSSPSKPGSSEAEGSEEREAEPRLSLHEPFQIWKQLYWCISFVQSTLVPL